MVFEATSEQIIPQQHQYKPRILLTMFLVQQFHFDQHIGTHLGKPRPCFLTTSQHKPVKRKIDFLAYINFFLFKWYENILNLKGKHSSAAQVNLTFLSEINLQPVSSFSIRTLQALWLKGICAQLETVHVHNNLPVLIVSSLHSVQGFLQGCITVFFIIHLLHFQAV